VKWLWTWDGKFFGYKDGDDIWTYKGKHIGKLDGTEIYDASGKYLGEIISDRLITCITKKNYQGFGYKPYGQRARVLKNVDYAGYAMFAGYEAFPPLGDFD
jgi:hypothetical protein